MPRSNATSRQLVQAARAMAPVAGQYFNTFTTTGLPQDFVTQLTAAADALDTSIKNAGTAKTQQTGATAGSKAEASRGQHAVKVLDALVEPALAGNEALLTQWRTAKRFVGKTGTVPSTSIDAASKGATGGTTADPSAPATQQPPQSAQPQS